MPINKRGMVMTIATGLAVHASSSRSLSLSMPSPIVRQGRAISESLLGIRLHMSRWQILRTLLLSAAAVAMVALATVHKLHAHPARGAPPGPCALRPAPCALPGEPANFQCSAVPPRALALAHPSARACVSSLRRAARATPPALTCLRTRAVHVSLAPHAANCTVSQSDARYARYC